VAETPGTELDLLVGKSYLDEFAPLADLSNPMLTDRSLRSPLTDAAADDCDQSMHEATPALSHTASEERLRVASAMQRDQEVATTLPASAARRPQRMRWWWRSSNVALETRHV
jgi:hypothetical protein